MHQVTLKCTCGMESCSTVFGEIEGSKVKIKNLPKVKEHWVKAKELNPNDGTALNLLGRWCKGIVKLTGFHVK